MCKVCFSNFILSPFEILQARIQEFSSGGVQIYENFDKQKKKKKKKKRRENASKWRVVVVFFSLLQKYGLNKLFRQLFLYKFIFGRGMVNLLYNCKPLSTQKHRCHGSFDIVNVSRMVGVWGSSPRKFWLNWCKIVGF